TDQWLAIINTGMCPPLLHEDGDEQQAILTIPNLPFVPGDYWIDLSLAVRPEGRVDYVERAVRLSVEPNDIYGSGYTVTSRDGVVFIDGSWQIVAGASLKKIAI